MKKLTIVIMILISVSAKAQTSVYHPFPDSNVIWNFHFSMHCFANGTGNEYYSITISGDTLINSQTYHKLTTPFVQSFSSGTCGGISTGYKGAIRQDTSIRKVFFVPPANSSEQLLYDFNMQVGDTVQGIIESWSSPNDIVQAIDSISIGSSYRKRWIINSCYNIYFIEGIGSTYGLFETSPHCYTDLADYSLTCFRQNDIIFYPTSTINCELITIIKESSTKTIQSYFSPNPFHTSTLLSLINDFEKAELNIYNTFGELVKQKKIISQFTTINRDELSDGIYLYQVINSKGNLRSGKLMIE